jgi:hypothetical protein
MKRCFAQLLSVAGASQLRDDDRWDPIPWKEFA